MTYFLQTETAPKPVPVGDTAGLTGMFEGLGAAFKKAQLENDSNFRLAREHIAVSDLRAVEAAKILGMDRIRGIAEERNRRAMEMGAPSQVRDMPESFDDLPNTFGPNFSQVVLDMARDAAKANPGAWQGVDLSEEGIEAEVNERLRVEHQDLQDTLDMMPGGSGGAELAGGIAGITADVKNVPFLLMGGPGGSFLRTMGREAVINMGAEAAFLPSQFEMADRLEIPDPDIAQQLLMATVGGAVFGGLFEAGARALRYYKGVNETQPIPGFDRQTSQEMVDAAEGALVAGDNPLKAVSDVIKPYLLENPLRPDFTFNDILEQARIASDTPVRVQGDVDFSSRLPRAETAIPETPTLPRIQVDEATTNAARYAAAKEVDPQAFSELERLQARAETLRRWLRELGEAPDKEVAEIISKIEAREAELSEILATNKTGGKRRIREEMKTLREAREEALGLSDKRETRDMAQVRRDLMKTDEAMRDLAPRVGRAYNQVRPSSPDTEIDAAWRQFAGLSEPPDIPAPRLENLDVLPTPEPRRQQPATRRLDQSRIEDEEGTLFGGAQHDLFSDPTSPEARAIHDNVASSMRDDIAADADADIKLDMGDGKGERRLSSILDDLDEGDEFADIIALCGKPKGAE